ncbi:hypothetical protein GGTG_10645 [Gaeumannomyces tritici R3-111a-1]|uniref:CENP-V/GFA domain-containing protein n=1 Tax=Gaeumannomyces tritici (strain R3-111a-1) TaxID=644352 RepID=J3PAX0_GAET3|nr:hypothetical protein GGTG_10645 [Gaeumannomyces tritici R3-111a-1]EJT71386.1 hypothetical protein GGTG_10645 [Gaeumannomyces tritici R3-111a-1]
MAEPSPVSAEEKQTYRGNCHCGAFVFEAFIPEIKEVKVCNCSICIKKNYAFAIVPDADFKVVKGDIEKDLTVYKFDPALLSHMFCSNCGTAVLGTYTKMPGFTAINARAVQGPLDLWKMAKNKYNGVSYKPEYVPPPYDDMPEPATRFDDEPSGGKLYHGSCHCGDVRVALRVPKPFDQDRAADFEQDPARAIVECNCSLCQRTGATWIYPNRGQVVIKARGGGDDPRGDAFSKAVGAYHVRLGSQVFCRRCGVYVANRLDISTDDEFAALPEGLRAYMADKRDWQPLNLRIFQDVELEGLNITEADGWNKIQPPYVNP